MNNKPLLDVLRGVEPSRRPIWLMRQAGRYLPEYRQVRAKAGSFLDLCYSPDLATEVTLQPLRRYDLDAAILFADILLLPQSLGCDLRFVENEGPRLSIVQNIKAVEGLSNRQMLEFLAPVFETVRRVKGQLNDNVTLIGFCGAPWTVASYMIEGGGSEERLLSRRAAFENPPWFRQLMDLLVESSIEYLAMQVRAGAEAVQIFDSWAGDLAASQWDENVFLPIKRIVEGLHARVGQVPVIGFARGIGAGHFNFAKITGVNAVGFEQGTPAKFMADCARDVCAVQGNLDPLVLTIGGQALDVEVKNLIESVPKHRHVFNLGHGIRQETEPKNVERMIACVRNFDLE